jgi:bacterioferritin-associated ferredoxin
MLVCHCKRVYDRQIRHAAREGAVSVQAVARECGAGAGCGGCHSAIEDILVEERASCAVELLSLGDFAAAR